MKLSNQFCLFVFVVLLTSGNGVAEPLQGGVEQDTNATYRIARPLEGQAAKTEMPPLAPPLMGKANETNLSSMVDSTAFTLSPQTPMPIGYIQPGTHQPPVLVVPQQDPTLMIPQHPYSDSRAGQTLPGNTNGGQDEEWIDWNPWLQQVGQLISEKLQQITSLQYGGSGVHFVATRDHHIIYVQPHDCDSQGQMARYYIQALKMLDGDPRLEFPTGSTKDVSDQWDYHSPSTPNYKDIWCRFGGLLALPPPGEYHYRQW